MALESRFTFPSLISKITSFSWKRKAFAEENPRGFVTVLLFPPWDEICCLSGQLECGGKFVARGICRKMEQHFFFSFLFWPPQGKWSSQARDQIWSAVATYPRATATPDPLTHCEGDWTCVLVLAEPPLSPLHHSRKPWTSPSYPWAWLLGFQFHENKLGWGLFLDSGSQGSRPQEERKQQHVLMKTTGWPCIRMQKSWSEPKFRCIIHGTVQRLHALPPLASVPPWPRFPPCRWR